MHRAATYKKEEGKIIHSRYTAEITTHSSSIASTTFLASTFLSNAKL